jgi:hypothetical protein
MDRNIFYRTFDYCSLWSIICLVLLFSSSCATKKILSEAPMKIENKEETVLKPKISSINLPISMPVKPLEDKINSQLETVLFEEKNLNDQNIHLKVSKSGSLKLFASDDFLYFKIPILIEVEGRLGANILGMNIGKSAETSFQMIINGKTSISITKNFELEPKTLIEYEWLKKPFVKIGPIDLPIKSIVEKIMDSQMGNISKQLDDAIATKMDMANTVKQAWIKIQEPILADPESKSYVLITPKELKMSSLRLQNNEIKCIIGIKSYIETSNGVPPSRKSSNILPRLVMDNKLEDNFEIILTGDLPYDYVNDVINAQAVGKDYDFQDKKYAIHIDSCHLYGSSDLLTVKLGIHGYAKTWFFKKKIKGMVFVQGVPFYDQTSNSIKIKNFDFSFKSKDAILKVASWITKVGFKEKIQSMMVFPLKDKLEEIRLTLQKSLNEKGKINEMIHLKGEVKEINPEGIYLTKGGLRAAINGKGKLNIFIDKL